MAYINSILVGQLEMKLQNYNFVISDGIDSEKNPSSRQICPGLNANEIQIPYDKHHKVSSLLKGHQNTHNCQICSDM